MAGPAAGIFKRELKPQLLGLEGHLIPVVGMGNGDQIAAALFQGAAPHPGDAVLGDRKICPGNGNLCFVQFKPILLKNTPNQQQDNTFLVYDTNTQVRSRCFQRGY